MAQNGGMEGREVTSKQQKSHLVWAPNSGQPRETRTDKRRRRSEAKRIGKGSRLLGINPQAIVFAMRVVFDVPRRQCRNPAILDSVLTESNRKGRSTLKLADYFCTVVPCPRIPVFPWEPGHHFPYLSIWLLLFRLLFFSCLPQDLISLSRPKLRRRSVFCFTFSPTLQ